MQKSEAKKKSTVALVRCESYDEVEVNAAVARGIDLLGGSATFFKQGEHIVLKPNVLVGVHPDHAATTHPAVLGAVMKELQSFGCTLSYGDSPGFGKPAMALRTAQLVQVAEKYDVPLADFEHGKRVTLSTAAIKKSFPLAKGVLAADGLVSVSKLKSHGLVRMTGAVKNQYGCIPGLKKTRYHAAIPFVNDFTRFIVDINMFIQPRLYIIDAVVAMEGNGPNSGDPKKLNCILLSADPVACDATASRIIALNPEHVPTSREGYRAGLGTYKEDQIKVVGDTINMFLDKSFKVVRQPAVSVGGTGIAAQIKLKMLPKPVNDPKRCTACGRCVDTCPVEPKALQWKKGRKKTDPPAYVYSDCIRCFCCQEICPEKAIYIRTPFINCLLPVVSMGHIGVSGVRFVVKQISRIFFSPRQKGMTGD